MSRLGEVLRSSTLTVAKQCHLRCILDGLIRARPHLSDRRGKPRGAGAASPGGKVYSKVIVATVLDATHTGLLVNSAAFCFEQMIAAAAPFDTGQISNSRSGLLTYGEASTSSSVTSFWKRA